MFSKGVLVWAGEGGYNKMLTKPSKNYRYEQLVPGGMCQIELSNSLLISYNKVHLICFQLKLADKNGVSTVENSSIVSLKHRMRCSDKVQKGTLPCAKIPWETWV